MEFCKPLVSVIMNFLNGEEFIQEAIESVIAQTYDNWEILLVDDGSTDGSTRIARQYTQNYPSKIFYLEHPNHQNLGKSASRNLGLEQSKGAYFTFLDADDIWLPTKLEKQVELLAQQPEAGMVCGPTLIWFSWQDPPIFQQEDWYRNLMFPANRLLSPEVAFKLYLQQKGIVPATCSVLIRREVLKTIGGFDMSISHICEDEFFFVKILHKNSIYVVDECLDFYRQHSKSSCYVSLAQGDYHPSKPSPSGYRYLQRLKQYFLDENITDPELWLLLKMHRLLPYERPRLYTVLTFFRKIKHSLSRIKHMLVRFCKIECVSTTIS
jgi:glycosyltransferase involved in cell wall biosynthesis